MSSEKLPNVSPLEIKIKTQGLAPLDKEIVIKTGN